MPLRKRPTPAVLPAEPDRGAAIEQGGKREMFARRPVERLVAVAFGELAAELEQLGDLLVGSEIGRNARRRAQQLAELGHRYGGRHLGRFGVRAAAVLRPQAGHRALRPLRPRLPGALQLLLELLHARAHQLFRLLRRRDAGLGELPRVDGAGGRLAADHLVHHRLRESRLVGLVVSVLAGNRRPVARSRRPPRDPRRSRGRPARARRARCRCRTESSARPPGWW